MAKIYVIGHKNPDTDATVTPIVVAWYFNKKDPENEYVPVVYNEPNKEALYVLDKFGFQVPEVKNSFSEGDKVIVVDTTNPDELPELEGVEVIAVFDHHKLGGLKTAKPLTVMVEPIGSSCSVVFKFFKNQRLGCKNLDPKIAGLMLSGIISDTLLLKSPTTTDFDRKAVKKLAEIAGVEDVEKLASEMFDAKSDLTGLSAKDILTYDAKEYEFSGNKSLVAVFETVKPQKLFDIYDDLIKGVEELKKEGYDRVYFFVIDIMEQTGYYMVLHSEEDEIIKNGYGVEIDPEAMFVELSGVVSRKKQIVPVLEQHA